MAKLSDRQKNNILAKWHTGQYAKTELAKVYKVDEKTIRDIVDKQKPRNAEIVEVGAKLEILKKSEKTPIETAEINKAIIKRVAELSIADEIKQEVLSGTLLNIKSVKKKIELEEIEDMQDHRHAQEIFDKALITSGKAPRHASQNIQVNTQNNIQTKVLSIDDIYKD